jgi:hypothetical protein
MDGYCVGWQESVRRALGWAITRGPAVSE